MKKGFLRKSSMYKFWRTSKKDSRLLIVLDSACINGLTCVFTIIACFFKSSHLLGNSLNKIKHVILGVEGLNFIYIFGALNRIIANTN